jgi:hypothetical protein
MLRVRITTGNSKELTVKLTPLALIAAGIVTISAAILGSAASAQEATPTPSPTSTTVPNLCMGGIPQRGGQTVNFGFLSTRVMLPGGGNFTILGVAPPPDTGFIVCYVEGNARVFISPSTCDEIRRENPTDNESADLLLDVIVDSCEVVATPTPTSTGSANDATARPTAISGGTITPPDTGSAGLR